MFTPPTSRPATYTWFTYSTILNVSYKHRRVRENEAPYTRKGTAGCCSRSLSPGINIISRFLGMAWPSHDGIAMVLTWHFPMTMSCHGMAFHGNDIGHGAPWRPMASCHGIAIAKRHGNTPWAMILLWRSHGPCPGVHHGTRVMAV